MKLRIATWAFLIIATACSSKSTSPSTPSGMPSAPPPPGDIVTCVQGEDSRTLEIKKTSGCELIYTKFGTSRSVASSSSSDRHCREVRDKISANLNRSGFKCE